MVTKQDAFTMLRLMLMPKTLPNSSDKKGVYLSWHYSDSFKELEWEISEGEGMDFFLS